MCDVLALMDVFVSVVIALMDVCVSDQAVK